jgi:hypothetical protein
MEDLSLLLNLNYTSAYITDSAYVCVFVIVCSGFWRRLATRVWTTCWWRTRTSPPTPSVSSAILQASRALSPSPLWGEPMELSSLHAAHLTSGMVLRTFLSWCAWLLIMCSLFAALLSLDCADQPFIMCGVDGTLCSSLRDMISPMQRWTRLLRTQFLIALSH